MEYRNFSISRSKGKLYLRESRPTEGYEEITYGTDNKKTYHKYFDSIKGVPTYFGVREVDYQGRKLRFLELSLVDGDTTNKVSTNLKNKGGYTDESKALLSALRGLEMGEEVTLSPKVTRTTGKNGREYENLNIYINYLDRKGADGKNLGTGYIPYNEIPSPTSSIVAGDKVWDWTPQTEFYYQILQEIENKFKSEGEPVKERTTATPQEAFDAPDNDDLPF